MNADLRRPVTEIEPFRLTLPEAARARLRLRLGRGAATGEALEASLTYGVPLADLSQLLDYWLNDFELDEQPLCRLPCFETDVAEQTVRFLHLRSHQPGALPLLLLHGYSAGLGEFQSLLEPLAETRAGTDTGPSFHVVYPSLPGFGLSDAAPCARRFAEACAALMQRLGYQRYVVHGSDLGAAVATELAGLDAPRVASLHLTALPSYPDVDPLELASLTRQEKSQLARLTELHEQLSFEQPETPIEALAFALSSLVDSPELSRRRSACDALLVGLTLAWALGSAEARSALNSASRLAPAPRSSAPIALHSFPLDAPTLRRFTERRHRVVEWQEHERGGSMPGVEQPKLLLDSLRQHFARSS